MITRWYIMLKQISVLFCACVFALQVSSTNCDLFEDAKAELESLRQLVHGAILVATDNLDALYLDFQVDSGNTVNEGGVLLGTEQSKIDSQITAVKDLAHTAGADISACLRGREEFLDALPGVILDDLNSCVSDKIQDASTVVKDSKYLVDVIYNRVNDIEFQMTLCSSESCVSPIIELIALEMVQLPEKVDIEVMRATELFDLLELSVQDCSDGSIVEYVASATRILKDLVDCANDVLGK